MPGHINSYVADASAAAANKTTILGYGGLIYGWATNSNNAVLAGLIVTALGGLWAFLAFLQKRREHKLRVAILEEELRRIRSGAALPPLMASLEEEG